MIGRWRPVRWVASSLAQQVGVAPGQYEPESLALEAVHEQFPARQVLDLIEQQVARIVVHGVDRGDQGVKARRRRR